MRRRHDLGIGLAVLAIAIAAAVTGCYDVPKPDCGFRCGPAAECPEDYTCAADGRCHLDGSSPSLLCGSPVDAGIDAYSPTVLDLAPGPGELNVSPATSISATFDVEVIDVTSESFELFDNDAVPVSGNVFYSAGTRVATFTPLQPLQPNLRHTASLSAAIRSAATGAPLEPLSWSFTTGADTTAPFVVATIPANGAMNVPVDTLIDVEFSEPVQGVDATTFTVANGGAIAGTVSVVNGGRTAIFDPTADLPAGTVITATLSTAITDVSGNPLATSLTYSFTTAP